MLKHVMPQENNNCRREVCIKRLHGGRRQVRKRHMTLSEFAALMRRHEQSQLKTLQAMLLFEQSMHFFEQAAAGLFGQGLTFDLVETQWLKPQANIIDCVKATGVSHGSS